MSRGVVPPPGHTGPWPGKNPDGSINSPGYDPFMNKVKIGFVVLIGLGLLGVLCLFIFMFVDLLST